MKNNTVLISVFHSFISKNFLNTDAFKILKDIPSIKYVLLVPEAKTSFFKKNFESENVEIVGVSMSNLLNKRSVRFFSRISHLLLKSHYLWYKKVERRDASRSIFRFIKYYIEILVTSVFGNRKLIRDIFRKLFLKNVIIDEISDIFDKYNPRIFFSSDVFDEADIVFSGEARRRNIHIVGMVRSWDNCYSKGVLRVIPDSLIINNKVLENEAVNMHDVRPEIISIIGIPQYDEYVKGVRTEKNKFFESIGADINKKLLLYSPAGAILSDTDIDICHILKDMITKKEIKYDVQFLVRNHPHHPADLGVFNSDKDLIVENPGRKFGLNNKEAELTKNDAIHLADSLYYSDIVIYTATTLGIDSLVFDKPQIVIDFDGFRNKKYTNSVKRFHNEDHMRKMLNCGGVWIVEDKKQLIEAINGYLDDSHIHEDGRKMAFDQQIIYRDGMSGHRLADVLKKEIYKHIR